MRITQVEIKSCIMPKKDKNWRFALAAYSESASWIVAITGDNGQTGHGYAQAVPHMGASYHGVKGVLDLFVPLLVGKDPFALDALLQEMDQAILENYQAKAAVDCAFYDLKARTLKVPGYELLGGKLWSAIPQLRIIPIKSPSEMAAGAQRLVDQGYRYLNQSPWERD